MPYFNFKGKTDKITSYSIEATTREGAIEKFNVEMFGEYEASGFVYSDPGCGCCDPGWEEPFQSDKPEYMALK